MSSKFRVSHSCSQQPISTDACVSDRFCVVLRDEKNDSLRIVPRKEIASAKTSVNVDVGDVVSHGMRNKRSRGTVLLTDKRRKFFKYSLYSILLQEVKINVSNLSRLFHEQEKLQEK